MTKIGLMSALAEIPGDYPITFKVPTDELDDTYGWMKMDRVSKPEVKDLWTHDEYVYDDIEELKDHIECHEDITDEAEIQAIVDKTPHQKMIVISVCS